MALKSPRMRRSPRLLDRQMVNIIMSINMYTYMNTTQSTNRVKTKDPKWSVWTGRSNTGSWYNNIQNNRYVYDRTATLTSRRIVFLFVKMELTVSHLITRRIDDCRHKRTMLFTAGGLCFLIDVLLLLFTLTHVIKLLLPSSPCCLCRYMGSYWLIFFTSCFVGTDQWAVEISPTADIIKLYIRRYQVSRFQPWVLFFFPYTQLYSF